MSYWTLKTLWLQKISVQGSNFTNLTWNGFPRRGKWIHCSQNFHCRGRYTAPMIQHCQQCQQGCPPWRRIHLPQWLVIMQISFAITLNAAAAIRRSRDTFFTGRCDGRSLPQWVGKLTFKCQWYLIEQGTGQRIEGGISINPGHGDTALLLRANLLAILWTKNLEVKDNQWICGQVVFGKW